MLTFSREKNLGRVCFELDNYIAADSRWGNSSMLTAPRERQLMTATHDLG